MFSADTTDAGRRFQSEITRTGNSNEREYSHELQIMKKTRRKRKQRSVWMS